MMVPVRNGPDADPACHASADIHPVARFPGRQIAGLASPRCGAGEGEGIPVR